MKTTIPLVGAVVLMSWSLPVLADAPAYKADKSFGKDQMKSAPVCVSIDVQDRLFVLLGDGTVVQFDTDGNQTGGFKADVKSPTTMTVADGRIYLFTTLTEQQELTFQGKKIKRQVAAGVGCAIYDTAGKKLGDLKLPEAMAATDAHFIGKELAVGDNQKSQIVFYELGASGGKVTRKITKGFRLCCGIFDFCPGLEPDTLVAANLGAFKVQMFKGTENTGEFGQRGEKPEDFRGCCNPVNVATFGDGMLVTVEKDPTRVKIFAKDHKSCSKVTGLTELVAGCSTIPIAVDSKGALFLASDTQRCIVKCVPGVSDKPEPPEPKEEELVMPEMSAGMKLIIEKVTPLMEAKEFAKAKAEADAIIKAHPEMPEDEKIQVELGIGLAQPMEQNDVAAALKHVDAVMKAHPDCELAKHAAEIKESIKQSMEARADDEPAEEESPKSPAGEP